MLQPDSKYIVFSSLISDADKVERTMNQLYEVNIKTWIRTKSNWRIPANYTIHPKLELIFGELFVHMGFGSQKVRLKLADLEKSDYVLSCCVYGKAGKHPGLFP